MDLARAVAAVFMLYGHAIDALLAPSYRSGIWHDAWLFQRGLTSCLFLLLSGFAFSIATVRHWSVQTTWSPAVSKRARRFLLFILLGYALHVPLAPVRAMTTASDEAWRALLAVDVLQLIGVAFIIVQALVMTLRSRAAVTMVALLLAIAVPLLTPVLWSVPWVDHLPLALAAYLSPATGSQFPLTPWLAFIFLGVALGQVYARWDSHQLPQYAGKALLIPALVMLTLWLVLTVTSRAMMGSGPANFIPSLVLIRAAACLLILTAIARLAQRITRLPHLVGAFAQETLIVYTVHIAIVYGSIWNPGLRSYFGATLTPAPLLLIIAILITSMFALAWWWNRWKHTHPRRVRLLTIAVAALLTIELAVGR